MPTLFELIIHGRRHERYEQEENERIIPFWIFQHDNNEENVTENLQRHNHHRLIVIFTDTKEKLIDEGRNTECPITYEEIKYNDSYLSCDACKYNFSESAILKHLNIRKRECPMCRAEWTNYCKYINKNLP